MRIWRDVFSVDTFKVIRRDYLTQTQRAISDQQSTGLRALDKMMTQVEMGPKANRGRATRITPQDARNHAIDKALDTVETALDEYHKLKKRDRAQFPLRRKHLALISVAAEDCIKVIGFTAQETAQRADYGMPLKDSRTGAHMFGDPRRESMARNLLTLQRRSLRKAEYLDRLEEHCEKHDDTHESIKALFKEKREKSKLIGLVPGVRMEAYDFMHRPFENHIDEDGELKGGLQVSAVSAALEEWLLSPKNGQWPFFVWLEGHSVCTGEDKSRSSEVRTVNYTGKAAKLRVVAISQPLQMVSLEDGQSAVASTLGYTAAAGKAIASGATGMAAFAWDAKKILYICEHVEGGFHHSSFMAGGHVRCAGMIKIDNGLVKEISNNSGHYKPPVENLKSLVKHLHEKGCLAAGAVVQICGGPKDSQGNPPVVPIIKGKFDVPKL